MKQTLLFDAVYTVETDYIFINIIGDIRSKNTTTKKCKLNNFAQFKNFLNALACAL